MTYQSIDVPDPSPANNARPRGWLTAVLRPAGTVDGAFAAAIGRSLADLSATADMVVVDLDAAQLPDAEAFVDLLRLPAGRLASSGKCLLLLNVPDALEHAVHMAAVPAAVAAAVLTRPGYAETVRPPPVAATLG
jgi:hypothetical protein